MINVIQLDKARIRILKRRHDQTHCDTCGRALTARDSLHMLANGKLRCPRCHAVKRAGCQPAAS